MRHIGLQSRVNVTPTTSHRCGKVLWAGAPDGAVGARRGLAIRKTSPRPFVSPGTPIDLQRLSKVRFLDFWRRGVSQPASRQASLPPEAGLLPPPPVSGARRVVRKGPGFTRRSVVWRSGCGRRRRRGSASRPRRRTTNGTAPPGTAFFLCPFRGLRVVPGREWGAD